MKHKKVSRIGYTFVLIFPFLVIIQNRGLARDLPNFLILIAGDAGRDFGCYGNGLLKTPNIDDLAINGIICQNAFLTTPESSASIISLLTGKYPHTTRTEDLNTPLPDGIELITAYLKDAGYVSGHAGRSQLGENGNEQFDWYSENLNDFGRFLDSIRRKPFFFMARFNIPHRIFIEPATGKLCNPDNVVVRAHLVDDENTRTDIAHYYDQIELLDSLVGTYVSMLKSSKKFKNTIIIFLSDNGAPFPREKGTLYDRGTRIPLIFSGEPVRGKGVSYDGLISTVDIAPTLLSLAGIDKPADLTGLDFSLLLEGNIALDRTFVYTERNWNDCDEHMRSVRNENYKLILNSYVNKPFGSPTDVLNSPSWASLMDLNRKGGLSYDQKLVFMVPRPEIELYDVKRDPEEYNNIANEPEYKKTVSDLLRVLVQWMDDTNDFPSVKRTRADQTDRISGKLLIPDRPPLENDIP